VLQGQPRRQAAELKAESTLVLKENDLDDPDSFARTLKPVVMEAIQDILDELETVYDNIAKSAKDHIHSEYVPTPPPFLSYLLTSKSIAD
jgi:translation initiation factor eIF-2B subunit beta